MSYSFSKSFTNGTECELGVAGEVCYSKSTSFKMVICTAEILLSYITIKSPSVITKTLPNYFNFSS